MSIMCVTSAECYQPGKQSDLLCTYLQCADLQNPNGISYSAYDLVRQGEYYLVNQVVLMIQRQRGDCRYQLPVSAVKMGACA